MAYNFTITFFYTMKIPIFSINQEDSRTRWEKY